MWKAATTTSGADGQALPEGVSQPAGMQLRSGLPQPIELNGAGRSHGGERFVEEGQVVGRRARGGAGLRGGAAQAGSNWRSPFRSLSSTSIGLD